MKTVNVFVCIQMDIPNQDEDQVSEVTQILELINLDLQRSGLDAQILSSDLDSSNIVNQTRELEIDDDVEMPDPKDDGSDSWNYGGWIGRIVDIRGDLADVEDGDGDVFSVELNRIELYND